MLSNEEEILKQNLVIEPDLQNFIDFAVKSVRALGGDVFAATTHILQVLQSMRQAGAMTGKPMMVKLVLSGRRLYAKWNDTEQAHIVLLPVLPSAQCVQDLRNWLQKSIEQIDPDILLQRNVEMMRFFDETRAAAERELKELQLTLKNRQRELLEATQQAETDGLTGLLNRRSYDTRIKQAFLHTMRQRNSPLSLMLFDLDFFKEINDTYGHQFGDAYLNKMAAVLREIIRVDVDMAFRFGGDEFAVLIFANYPLACTKAQQVLEKMENKVSIGISAVNVDTSDDLTLDEFIRQADNALYEAKRRGRGQAIVELNNQFVVCCNDGDSVVLTGDTK